jgi:hypothetical protein
MSETIRMARRAGFLYFVFSLIAIVGEFLIPPFMVPGDAAATARNIVAGMQTYRMDILLGFATLVLFIFLVASLYRLLQGVAKSQALLMVLLVSVGVAVSLANLLNKFAPLVLLSGADYWSAFTKPQLDALVLGFLGLHRSGTVISTAFWGLWLFPFGFLVIRSGFIPRIFGILLMVAGIAYLTSSITAIALPEYRSIVSRFTMPLYFGEVPIIFWLMIKGARAPQAR